MNRTMLITGSSSGIGKAIAYRFAKENWKLILIARRLDRLKEIKKILSNNKILIEAIDVRDEKSICNFLNSLPEEFKYIDVLCNNAGLDIVGTLINV
jgi:NADP-dependent 3-hydroxy acid dehydrogenase YdfG